MFMRTSGSFGRGGRIAIASFIAAFGLVGGCERMTASREASPAAPAAPAAHTSEKDTADMRDMRSNPNATPARPASIIGRADIKPIEMSDADWSKKLTEEQYAVLREKGTERAFTGKYWKTKPKAEQAKDQAIYRCAACGLELFRADSKFDSGCGWPSFDKMIQAGTVLEIEDNSHGMARTEVVCARCKGHLGHLFDDGPTETGLRYCINSVSIVREEPGQGGADKGGTGNGDAGKK